MQLRHIPLDQLDVSRVNMRHARAKPEIGDILPSVRSRGVLQPLLVRPTDCEERYEIVAGRRRYFAALAVAEENKGTPEPLPCAVMEPGDDAAALEASILENVARLAPDEMSQYEAFARLVRQGRSVGEIAATFGVTERMVERRLALGNLVPGIRSAFRAGKIDATSIRHLTLASKAQQKAWLALFRDPENHAPRGPALRDWLFGGQSIPVAAAIFDVAAYDGGIVTDLFGDERYFADTALFWQMQNAAVAARREALLADGWQAVHILEPGRYFAGWEHAEASKADGGHVFIEISHRGDVSVHDGWISHAEARRRAAASDGSAAGAGEAQPKSETTRPLQDYLDLHRLAAVRLSLLDDPCVALRLLVAHAAASSGHWQVRPEPGTSRNEAVAESVAASPAAALFQAEQNEIRALLERPEGEGPLTRPGHEVAPTVELFARLLRLDDADVGRVAALVMAETLEAGSAMVEAAGNRLQTDPAQHWQADRGFFQLIRDRTVMQAILTSIGGTQVADGNAAEKLKTQRRIALDLAEGTNGRAMAEGWLPGWMRFPAERVTDDGACEAVSRWESVSGFFEG
ncbi:ParB/RepB/Spo0J family partition protein [Minwuia sp.]|uniref:ParB/RepB/Spo0J family partition protein n=1 Tax=Minwuia sp. TaxID=2493630 RepID=UPI003A8ED285